MRAGGEHTFLDLYEKARLALRDRRTIKIAMTADSPTSGENTAERQGFGKTKRIATAALVRLRNKSAEIFWEIPEVVKSFIELTDFERNLILAELPETIRTALEAKRERKSETDDEQ